MANSKPDYLRVQNYRKLLKLQKFSWFLYVFGQKISMIDQNGAILIPFQAHFGVFMCDGVFFLVRPLFLNHVARHRVMMTRDRW